MATARHVARVHAGGGGAPPAATERHGGGGSVTPARTAARPPGTARPRPGRGGGRPSPRGGQTERGRWGGAARPSGPRGRRRGVLRRALSRALAAPGDARRSGVREGGGRRAPRLGAPPGVGSALARAGRAPSRQGRGKPLGRPGSCPRPPRPAPAGRPHPAGGAGGGEHGRHHRAAAPGGGGGARRRERSREARGDRAEAGVAASAAPARPAAPRAAGSRYRAGGAARRGAARRRGAAEGPGWAPSPGPAAPSHPAGGAGRGPSAERRSEGLEVGKGGKSASSTASPEPPAPPRGPEGLRGGGGEAPAVRKPSRAAGWRLCGSMTAGSAERGGPDGLRERGAAATGSSRAAYLLRECEQSSLSPLFAFPFSCRLPLVWVFSYQRSFGFRRSVKSSWDNGAELGVHPLCAVAKPCLEVLRL